MLCSLLRACLQWLFLLACNIVLLVVGLPVVALAIPFRVAGVSLSDGRAIVNLPAWVWLFGNDYDGLLGDKRGWWAANTPFGVAVDSFLAMWWWAAVRNPVNNMRLVSLWSCPVSQCDVTYYGQAAVRDAPGEGGWQFVIAKRRAGGWRRWYGFYWVHQWSDTRAFVVRMGFKISPGDNSTEPDKGMTTKVNVWKDIG